MKSKKSEYEIWISKLKETGYTNLTDLYEIGNKLGENSD